MKAVRAALALATALALAACGSSTVPRDHYYRLMVAAPAQALSDPLIDGALEVHRFAADGLLAERALLYSYRAAPREIDRYDYHFWIEPPSRLLQGELVGYLRRAGAAAAVITPGQSAQVAYVVTAKIKRFERVMGSSDASVLVELEFGLGRDGDGGLELIQVYRAEKKAANGLMSASIDAFSQAVAEIFRAFLADIGRNAAAAPK
jgi:ABC-type uncharacterized transport system auxiliary subunit